MSDVRIGGLYRCCVAWGLKNDGTEGQVAATPCCNTALLFTKGAWEWAR